MKKLTLKTYEQQKIIEILRRENKELRDIIIEMKLDSYRDKDFTLRVAKKSEAEIINDYK